MVVRPSHTSHVKTESFPTAQPTSPELLTRLRGFVSNNRWHFWVFSNYAHGAFLNTTAQGLPSQWQPASICFTGAFDYGCLPAPSVQPRRGVRLKVVGVTLIAEEFSLTSPLRKGGEKVPLCEGGFRGIWSDDSMVLAG